MFLITYFTSALVVSILALEAPFYDVEQADKLFEEFIIKYGKSFKHQEEKDMKLQIFTENLKKFNEKNSRGDSVVFGINYFADLAPEEIKRYMGFQARSDEDSCKVLTDKDIITNNAPKSFDWVKLGAVTSVKNQGSCRSGYAFSTIGNIEGQYYIKKKKLLEFSVQEIIDCSDSNGGCGGGIMERAINDFIKLGGVQLNSSYPYVGIDQTCQFDRSKVVVQLKGCTTYNLKDENKLLEVVAKRGPISILVDPSGMAHYQGGILSLTDCPGENFTHDMLLVGYGTDEKGIDYWLIKNTSGPEWGENGYIRITRGENTCGFLNPFITMAEL